MNDEQIVLTLPDTQDADSVCLTQSQALSQEKTLMVWGRLCPIKLPFKTMGMILCISFYIGRYARICACAHFR